MKINFLPRTVLGKWSIKAIVLFFLATLLFFLMIALGARGGDTFFSNFYLTVPALSMGFFGVSAFFTGLMGIIKKKDYSVLVFLSTIIGFLVLFFCLVEVLFPH